MKILLVDDAAFVRMSLKKILDDAAFGFEYVEAGDGEEAIEKYKLYSPDLVIMDITMPKMDGMEVLRRLRKEGVQLPIIMLTARDSVVDKVVDAITAGAKDFIIKPYEAEKVIKSVKAVLKLDKE